MDKNTMKNIIVLKNLPSNMIDEAFVVFKDNVKVHKLQKIEKKNVENRKENDESKDYMVKEAEMVVTDYISKIEEKEDNLIHGNRKITEKYKRLKYLTLFLGMFSIFSIVSILLRK